MRYDGEEVILSAIYFFSEDEFDESYHRISLTDYRMNIYEIRRVANLIKEELSESKDITEQLDINLPNDESQIVEVNFNREELEDYIRAVDRKIGIPDDNKYYLYVKATNDSELEKLNNPMSGT